MTIAVPIQAQVGDQDATVLLRPASPDDAGELARWSAGESDPWSPLPGGASEGYWRAAIEAGTGEERTWMICCVSDSSAPRAVGTMSVGPADYDQRVVEIGGYWVSPEARGAGVATAAIKALTGYLCGPGGFWRVQVLTRPDNLASRRAAERAGFRQEGVLRSLVQVAGERCDAVLLAWVRGDAEGQP